jgi:hypothetical protein
MQDSWRAAAARSPFSHAPDMHMRVFGYLKQL